MFEYQKGSFPMTEMEFQQQVIERLAVLHTKVEGIVKHLDALNSKVARQEQENFDRQLELNSHIASCPDIKRIEDLERFQSSVESKRETNMNWLEKALPVVYSGIGAIVILILNHSSEILKGMFR